jgi:quercetin dioxygenase-like cupin family protein
MPTLYITGLTEEGLSTVVERRELLVEGGGHVEALRLADTAARLPEGSSDVVLLESPTAPGGSLFNVFTWEPGQRTPMHRTITTDFDAVLHGSVDMALETETVTLEAGDCAVLPGIAHAWISGPQGAIVLYALLSGHASGADLDRPREQLL